METLCRVSINSYFKDMQGYLLTHKVAYEYAQYKVRLFEEHVPKILMGDMKRWLPLVPSHDHRKLPLVHPDEWQAVARVLSYIFPAENTFRLLTIDKSKVEDLSSKVHPALLHREFFGKVHESAIIKDEGYKWVKNNIKNINISEPAERFIRKKLGLNATKRLEEYLIEKI